MMRPKEIWTLVKEAASAWSADYAPSMGAALSYYTLFSIAPLLLIVISVAGLVFGDEAVRGELSGALQGLMGEDGAKAVEGMLASVGDQKKEGIIGTIVGIFVLLLGATTVFGELQNDLDRIWRAPTPQKSGGVFGFLRQKLLSIGMILGIAFLLMVSLVLDAVLSALGKFWGDGALQVVGQVLNLVVSFGLTTVVFALIYKLMPRVKVEWHDVWVGAAVTAFLFAVGKFLIGLYIGRSAVASTFGAAGSLAVMMVWVYYSAQIFLLGAEFTWVYSHSHGSRKGQKRPGAVVTQIQPQPVPEQPVEVQPVRIRGPVIRPEFEPQPVFQKKPVVLFGAAAVLGIVAGILARNRDGVAQLFHRKPTLLQRLKLR